MTLRLQITITKPLPLHETCGYKEQPFWWKKITSTFSLSLLLSQSNDLSLTRNQKIIKINFHAKIEFSKFKRT
jgi:hypothetical protein